MSCTTHPDRRSEVMKMRVRCISSPTLAVVAALYSLAAPTAADTSETELLKERIAYSQFRLVLEQLSGTDLSVSKDLLEESVAAVPRSVESRFLLAFVYERLRDDPRAKEQYQRILDLSPGNRFASIALENLRKDEAQAHAEGVEHGAVGEMPLHTTLEQQLADLINEERTQRRLRLLQINPIAVAVAREHSDEMRDKNYFSHDSPTPDRKTPLDRYLLKAPEKPAVIAENISRRWSNYEYSLNAANIATAHRELMDSKHHRENILLRDVTHLGIGIAVNERGDFWITELFVRPR